MFCYYLKIEIEDADGDEDEGSDSESGEALDLSKVTEMRLIPSDVSQCKFSIFSVVDEFFLCFCASFVNFMDASWFLFDGKRLNINHCLVFDVGSGYSV